MKAQKHLAFTLLNINQNNENVIKVKKIYRFKNEREVSYSTQKSMQQKLRL